MKKLFLNAHLVLSPEEGIQHGSLLVDEGGIIGWRGVSADQISSSDEIIDCEGDFLSPGFIDIHCHGAIGRDAMEATEETFQTILDYHAARGTTHALLSTVAASWGEMERVLHAATFYREQSGNDQGGFFGGIHLEGPYFSLLRRGAHRSTMLRHPSIEETEQILSHASVIKRITLAPELPGVLELVAQLTEAGITVSAGHSEATEAESVAGFDAGITQVTHLYNCMSSLHSREGKRFTGLAEVALTTPEILCEVIADARHVSSTLLRLAWLAKGWHSLVLVSDATAGAGLGEGNTFELGGLACRIEEGAAWTGQGTERRLAGSCITLFDGVRVMVEAGIPLVEAVAIATLVPARSLNIDSQIGSLSIGKQADLVRFSENWEIQGVWKKGVQL